MCLFEMLLNEKMLLQMDASGTCLLSGRQVTPYQEKQDQQQHNPQGKTR